MSQRHNDRDATRAPRDPALERWVDLGAAGDSASGLDDVEHRIGKLLAKVSAPPPLGRAAHARVEARLLGSKERERTASRGWFGRLAMGSGLGALSVLLLSGVVIAAGGVGAWWKLAHSSGPSRAVPAEARDKAGPRERHRARPRAVARVEGRLEESTAQPELFPEVAGQPGREPVPAAAPLSSSVPRPRAPAPRPSTGRAAAAPTSTALAEETRLLGGALGSLRQQHDGAAALAAVNVYLRHFPNGTLLVEAQHARIDALLLLGRREEALHALDSLDLDPIGRGQELLLIRGELRARRDCADATADFDVVLRHAAPPRLAERALFGRAVCRQQEGRPGAAREDALTYLERFPGGRFADAARRLASNGGLPSTSGPSEER